MDRVWLKTSVFYARNCWHELLDNAMSSFLADLQKDEYIDRYLVLFGDMQGDHIKMSLEIPHNEIQGVNERIYQFFNDYLGRNPSLALTGNKHPQFFMNFRNNSVHTNLYKHPFTAQEFDTRYHISQSLLKAFKNDEVEAESTLTFTIYMLAALLKTVSPHISNGVSLLMEIQLRLTDIFNKEHIQIEEIEATKIFDANIGILTQIFHDVWFPNSSYLIEFDWLVSWGKYWTESPILPCYYPEIFISVNNMINNHLNILDNRHLLISTNLLLKLFVINEKTTFNSKI